MTSPSNNRAVRAAVGRALLRRGHQVTLFHIPDMKGRAQTEGLGFAALGCQDFPAGTLAQSVATLRSLSGRAALRYSVECACTISNAILRDGPEIIGQAKIDALLVDQNEPDQKVLAVPNRNPRFDQIHTIDQVFPHNLREIEHFFAIYKELEEKRTEMRGWRGPRETRDLIRLCRDRYLKQREGAATVEPE